MDNFIFIGADGGGTHTSLAALNREGEILGTASAGGINFNAAGLNRARSELKRGIDILKKSLGGEYESFLCIGSSALDGFATEKQLDAFVSDVFDPDRTFMCSDTAAALYALNFGRPGAMLISGTGMMGAALSPDGELIFSGGYGYLLGDEGGGFGIGCAGIASALRCLEGVGAYTALSEDIKSFYGFSDYREFISSLYGRPDANARVAAFAERVLERARLGDIEAEKIRAHNLEILLAHAEKLLRELDRPDAVFGVYGGLFEKNPDVFACFREKIREKYPGVTVKLPETSPAVGAVICALIKKKPEGWEKILKNIQRHSAKRNII